VHFSSSTHTPSQSSAGGRSRNCSTRASMTRLGGSLRVDREASLKSAHGLIPGAAPISGERCPIRRAQLALLLGEIALAAEQLEDVLGLGLAADQHGVDLA